MLKSRRLGLINTFSSDPDSAEYGRHLTADEVVSLFAPAQSTVDAVMTWLIEAGIEAKRLGLSTNKQVRYYDK